MEVEYDGPVSIKLEKCYSQRKNACRIFSATNAVNYFRGEKVLDTEQAFAIFDKDRLARGLPPLNLDEVCLGDDEVNKFIDKYGGDVGSLMREGVGSLDLDFWRDLVQVGFLIIPDHQLLYSDPKDPSRTGFFHFSPELIEQAISEGGFSYQTFRQLYSQFLSRAGQIDEGHVDIIVGVRKINGIDCIILANSSAVRNGPPLAIPWNLFKNYLALDWSLPVITDIGQLPNEEQMQQIREKGSLDIGEANFFYGSYDIYYPKDRQRELDEILEKHHLI